MSTKVRDTIDGFDIVTEPEGEGWNVDVRLGPDTWALFAQDETDGWTCWGFSSGPQVFAQRHSMDDPEKVPDCQLRHGYTVAVETTVSCRRRDRLVV